MIKLLAVGVSVALIAGACTGGGAHSGTSGTTAHPGGPPPVTTPTRPSSVPPLAKPTAGATDVRSSGAPGDGTGDDTAAFLKAEDTALASTVRFPKGPSGIPQAVVFVPPGTYRLLRLGFRSNVRMEVDAGAVLAQAGGRNVDVSKVPALIQWDGPAGDALKNVSLVGVNSSAGGRKQLAEPLFPGWSVDPDFTFDLDPGFTNSNEAVAGVQALNVDGFLIQNVFSIENDSQPKVAPSAKQGWWPQSRKAALGLRERSDAPPDGSAYYDPHNGTIENWYNVHAPKGFGPNQINAGHNLTFGHIFSRGGTSLRFETDASQGKSFASELRGVTAADIVGENCNRAVAFAPHAQDNYDVHVSKVQAVSCADGVIESFDESNKQTPGKFADSTIADVTVTSGNQAQDSLRQTSGLWVVDISEQAFAKDPQTRALWSVVYTIDDRCTGTFKKPSDEIMTAHGFERPKCN